MLHDAQDPSGGNEGQIPLSRAIVTRNFDEVHSSFGGWDHCFDRLVAGGSLGYSQRIESPVLQVMHSKNSGCHRDTGTTPIGTHTLIVPARADHPVGRYLGLAFSPDRIISHQYPNTFEYISGGHNDLYVITIPDHIMAATAAELGFNFRPPEAGVLQMYNESSAADIRNTIESVSSELYMHPQGQLVAPHVLDYARESILMAILQGTASPDVSDSEGVRIAAARAAKDYIENQLHHRVLLSELCKVSGVGARSLQLGFLQLTGLSPIAYSRVLRLNGARRDLRTSSSNTTVADVAIKWNFFHLGRFSADYKALFGEKPSQMLRQRGQSPVSHN